MGKERGNFLQKVSPFPPQFLLPFHNLDPIKSGEQPAFQHANPDDQKDGCNGYADNERRPCLLYTSIAEAARRLRPYFPSIGVEVYSMSEDDYRMLVDAGVDSFRCV